MTALVVRCGFLMVVSVVVMRLIMVQRGLRVMRGRWRVQLAGRVPAAEEGVVFAREPAEEFKRDDEEDDADAGAGEHAA